MLQTIYYKEELRLKIAIVGSGISGLTCAYLLSRGHEVQVFESNDYIGGHTHTVDVDVSSKTYSIDTGFIVFNDWTYPNFIELIKQLGVPSQETSMSFSVKTEASGLEYNGTDLNRLFAQRSNLLSPRFYRMIRDILRFGKEAPRVLKSGWDSLLSLKEYLDQNGYSDEFRNHYIVPMGAAIWSASVRQMEDFPIGYFVRFFKNHGMLSVGERPQWRVIQGGSKSYIAPITSPYRERIHLATPVLSVNRFADHVTLTTAEKNGQQQQSDFDHVIFASHSDQTLRLLKDASGVEREILSAFKYQPNSTILHTDQTVLPKRKLAWAAWNYFVPKEARGSVAVTYDMNILQRISSPTEFCVSLNLEDRIDPAKILKTYIYHHPVYDSGAVRSQSRWAEVSGKNRAHFCGAYWGFGFHEDGVNSALRVCEMFNEKLFKEKL
jgi:predicted NAD/FAD-binding protein